MTQSRTPSRPLVPAQLLRRALGSELTRLQSMAPSKPDLHAVLEASQLIETSTGISLNVTVERNDLGEIKVLRRRAPGEYIHNLGVNGDEYVDFWMYCADMGSTSYANFLDATLAFCEPYKADIVVLMRNLGPADDEA